MRGYLVAGLGNLALAIGPLSAQAPPMPFTPPAAVPTAGAGIAILAPSPVWKNGTPLELMVIREINSRDAHSGDRVRLRVNAPVLLDGQVAIPVGSWAWAEVITASGTGAAGGRGHIALRLLNVETPWGPVAISGTTGAEGKGNTAGVVLSVLAFGPLGLLIKGGNANFKAGDLVTAHIDQSDQGSLPQPLATMSDTH